MSSSPNSSSSSKPDSHPLRSLFDLKIPVDVVVGTAAITVADCLRLRPHTVIQLLKASGANLDLMAPGAIVASGEVVIVDNSTALRVTDIAQPPSAEPHQ